MMRDIRNEQPDKLMGVAAILASVPKGVWYAVLALMFAFLGIVAWNHRDNIASFTSMVFMVLCTIGVTVIIVYYVRLGYSAYKGLHEANMMSLERQTAVEKLNKQRLQNQMLVTKIEMEKQLPLAMRYAIESGLNVEYEKFKISDWKSNIHMFQPGALVEQIAAPNVILPAKTEMIAIARRHQFNRENIFLALGREGDLTTTVESYLHCANDGNTGSGKTTNWRGQLVQFLLSGIDCILLNPNFALITKDGMDWKPIAKALQAQGPYDLELPRVVTKLENIGAVLDYMATVEIDRRFALMREGDFSYKPLYLYIDEWPEIALKCKGANDNLGTLLRRGRAVELCVSVNSQGFLKEDTDLKGSARENFATAFFLGGSTYSGAKLLDISQKELEELLRACKEPIGKGVALLRNNQAMPNPEVVRLPLADNEFLYYMLGRDDDFRLPPETVPEVEASGPNSGDLDRVYEVCMQLKEEGKGISSRSVAPLVRMGKTKVAELLNKLEAQGCQIR